MPNLITDLIQVILANESPFSFHFNIPSVLFFSTPISPTPQILPGNFWTDYCHTGFAWQGVGDNQETPEDTQLIKNWKKDN